MINASHRRVARLAWADMAHEWILTLCIVLSLGAVLSPLFILLGLKYGIIETMLNDLRMDPINREICPETLLPFVASDEWVQTIRARWDVAFITPNLRGLGLTVDLRNPSSDARAQCQARPSASGDPLLEMNKTKAPGAGEAVLSAPLAERLALRTGDKVEVTVLRMAGNKREAASAVFAILGVAARRASDAETIWLAFDFLAEIETYLAGGAVPRLGWEGAAAAIEPRFDGAIVASREEIPEVSVPRLTATTGFGEREEWDAAKISSVFGFEPKSELHFGRWRAIGNTVNADNIARLEARLADSGVQASVLPWVADLPSISEALLELGAANLTVRIVTPDWIAFVTSSPEIKAAIAPESTAIARKIAVPAAHVFAGRRELHLQFAGSGGEEAQIPLTVMPSAWLPGGAAAIAPELAGKLNTARFVPVRYDAGLQDFVPKRRGYRDFRLYAANLDAIEPLVSYFEDQGVAVRSNRLAVLRVRLMEGYMDKLYLLMAGVICVAAFFALLASLYANVQRKRAALAYMQLVGFSRSSLFCFPIYQALALSGGALLFGWSAFSAFTWSLQTLAGREFGADSAICVLTRNHLAILSAGTLAAAMTAAVLSALSLLRLDPAQNLRHD